MATLSSTLRPSAAAAAARLSMSSRPIRSPWGCRRRPVAESASRRALATSSSSSSSMAATVDHDRRTNPRYPHLRPNLRPVVPHPQTSQRTVSPSGTVPLPPYALTGIVPHPAHPDRILLHSPTSIIQMRNAARLARRVLEIACDLAVPGVATDEIDGIVHDEIVRSGAYPSPLNYAGFPKSLCSSVNEVICHGIPDSRVLRSGDVVSFDVSCYLDGVHGDNCATVVVGDRDDDEEEVEKRATAATTDDGSAKAAKEGIVAAVETDWRGVPVKTSFASPYEAETFASGRRLVHATRESLLAAIDVCRPGGCLSHVGTAVSEVAESYGYDSVQKYRGHGIGTEFHCAPFVKHYRNSDRMKLLPGMIFTIEPMLVEGDGENVHEWDDGWTVVTTDGGRAAQFEHTVLITEDGVEILTTSSSSDDEGDGSDRKE